MTERRLLRLAILVFWTLFWGLSVTDKIIPDVQHLWVGKDFFALFIKFFASLGLKDPLFATAALALVSGLEAVNFGLYLAALVSFRKGDAAPVVLGLRHICIQRAAIVVRGQIMRQIDHKAGVAPGWPLAHTLGIEHHNTVRWAQLRQTARSGQPRKTRADHQPVSGGVDLQRGWRFCLRQN